MAGEPEEVMLSDKLRGKLRNSGVAWYRRFQPCHEMPPQANPKTLCSENNPTGEFRRGV